LKIRSIANEYGSVYPFYFFTKHHAQYKLISSD